MSKQILHIGIDDTDSPKGMCTTFLAYKIINRLKKENVDFLDFPNLVRFNPNIPWKTRGNGAVGIKISTSNPKKIKNLVKKFVKQYSDVKNGANPGLVFCQDENIPSEFSKLSSDAMWKLIHRNEAKKILSKYNFDFFYLGNGQGLVGATGVIGYNFQDETYELLSYRKSSQFGKKRFIDKSKVKEMQEKTYPNTFNSFDSKKNKVLLMPHGPDPVFYGVRGENSKTLISASKMIDVKVVNDALDLHRVDQRGLDATDRSYLGLLVNQYKGGPVGIETLAAALGEDSTTLETVVEPYLMQIGFLQRTSRGRVVTQAAEKHYLLSSENKIDQ